MNVQERFYIGLGIGALFIGLVVLFTTGCTNKEVIVDGYKTEQHAPSKQ